MGGDQHNKHKMKTDQLYLLAGMLLALLITLPNAARAQVNAGRPNAGRAKIGVNSLPVENQFFELTENEDDLKQIVAFSGIKLVT